MQWQTQAGKITTNSKVNIDFILPELSAMKIVMQGCHVDDSVKGRYDMILGRDILTSLVLNLKLSNNVIEAYRGPSKGFTALMVDLGTYKTLKIQKQG